MRRISLHVLTMLLMLPGAAMAARLPVVNVAAGAVSARAAFGEGTAPTQITQTVQVAPAVASSETTVPATPKKLVARSAKKTAPIATPTASAKPIDNGGDIIARGDVLMPRRPSADLWAKSDTALRIPSPSEFSVLRSDDPLPEEDINAPIAANMNIAPRDVMVVPNDNAANHMDEIDSQIARLVELQRRADESVRATPSTLATNSQAVASHESAPTVASRNAVTRTPVQKIDAAPVAHAVEKTNDVRLSRMVVPMTPDAVVRTVEKNESPRIASVRDDMTKMSPTELRKAFRKTFLSENKHLSTFQIDDRFDVASDMTASVEGFTARRDLSENAGIRPLEIKIRFKNDDSALSRDNYNLLTEYASIVVSNPKRAIQVSIPQSATRNADDRKLAARRLAIVEQVLRDTGVSEQRIMPVLSQRNEEGFVLRIISGDQYETLSQQQRDMFGDTVSKKTYKSMSW